MRIGFRPGLTLRLFILFYFSGLFKIFFALFTIHRVKLDSASGTKRVPGNNDIAVMYRGLSRSCYQMTQPGVAYILHVSGLGCGEGITTGSATTNIRTIPSPVPRVLMPD